MRRPVRPRARMNELKATRYQRSRRRTAAASLCSAAGALAIIGCTPLAAWIGRKAIEGTAGVTGPTSPTSLTGGLVSLTVFVIAVVVICEIATLPAVFYQALRVDKTYGRRALTVEEVLGGQAQGMVIGAVAAILTSVLVRTAMAAAGTWWWALAGIWLAVLLAVALRAAPVLFITFGHIRPLTRPNLALRLDALAERARVSVAGIDEWQVGTHDLASALVTGVGRSRRVLVSSELTRDWTDDEIAVVVAHELAHHAHGDLWWTLGLQVCILSVSLWLSDAVVRGLAAPLGLPGPLAMESLPLIALVAGIVWLAAAPVRHAQSRSQERRADAFALAVTGGADAFGAAIRRLGARHLAEEHPSALTRWLYHRHPSVQERLAVAATYKKSDDRGIGSSAIG